MITRINLLIAGLWLISALVDYSEFCYLWQLKEYRWDRFRDFLSTHQGKTYWFTYSILWRSVVAMILFFWPFDDIPMIKFAIFSVLFIDLLYTISKGIRRKFRHPKFTTKASAIILTSLIIEASFIALSRDWVLVFLLLIARFFLISAVIGILRYPTDAFKRWKIKTAEQKLRTFPHLRVIGITGSYGKTTTKAFLAHILSDRFRVEATPKHVNTDIGIALFILKTDFSDTDFFIVEMGAYREGEVQAICDMVHPEIGVLTAINEQHLSLFGSIEAIQKTKYELLRSLPSTGLAVTNADNPYCRAYIKELQTRTHTFGYEEDFHPTLLIQHAEERTDGIRCQFQMADHSITVHAPILGAHNATNIAACFLVADVCGVREERIIKRCETLELPNNALHTYRYGSCIVLNDSYNSNPDGFKSALHILSGFPSGI